MDLDNLSHPEISEAEKLWNIRDRSVIIHIVEYKEGFFNNGLEGEREGENGCASSG